MIEHAKTCVSIFLTNTTPFWIIMMRIERELDYELQEIVAGFTTDVVYGNKKGDGFYL